MTWGTGTDMTITAGPRSANGYVWWELDNRCWSAGSYLKLVSTGSGKNKNPPPPPPPPPRPRPPPPPPPPSINGISVGKKVTPTVSGLNCRKSPSLSGAIDYTWSSGEVKTVTAGPKSANGYNWWEVDNQCWSAGSLLKLDSGGSPPGPQPGSSGNTPIVNTGSSGNCGGNCPGGACPDCPCGTESSPINIDWVCSQWTGWSQDCCRCIVSHESGGNGHAMNYNTNGSFDVGVFQINQINWGACNGGKIPCDWQSNLKCAKQIYSDRSSFGAWSTCSGCGCC